MELPQSATAERPAESMLEATRRFMSSSITILSSTDGEAADTGGVGARAQIRSRLHRVGSHVVDLGHRIDHDADGLLADRQHATRTTMTTVELSKGLDARPKRARRSITGTMTPRRFMTPST